MKKVSIIGAGNVGSTLAQLIARAGIADIVLFDVVEGMPQGKALDIFEACPLWNSPVSVKGTNDYRDIEGSHIVVVTAGLPRKPGMSRDDLLIANAEIIKRVSEEIKLNAADAIVIVVTNPMDAMAQLTYSVTGFQKRRVVGMGGVLDSSRLRAFISLETGVSPQDVEALVLGGHGDHMVPLKGFVTIKGIPVKHFISPERLQSILQRTKNGGAEIVSLLKTGSAFYAPAQSTFEMVKAIILDEKRLLPCSVYLDGEYGVRGVFGGVPVILGKDGVERIIEIPLDDEEKRLFMNSIDSVRSLLDKLAI